MNLIDLGITMTSLDLVEITGRRHADIMKEIRKEINDLGNLAEGIFSLSEYVDKSGKKNPMYTFGRKGAMQMAMKYSAEIRFKVIERLEELENKNKPTLPQTYLEALEALIKSEREKIQVIEENKVIKEEIKYKNEVIVDITESVPAKTMRKMINSIIRKNTTEYADRWNLLYSEFYSRYSVNLKVRAEHRQIKTLDYAETFGYIKDLYNLTIELFEAEYESIKDKFIGIRY